MAKSFIRTKEPELESAFGDWLARLVCFAFSPGSFTIGLRNSRYTYEPEPAA